MKKHLITFIILLLACQASHAQKIRNIKVQQQGKDLIISYDIEGGSKDKVFIPSLHYSTDGGSNYQKCRSIKAAAGKPNKTNQITWHVTKDLDYFGGDNIVFKVVGYTRYNIGGHYYKAVIKIGNKLWMAENLRLDVGNGCYCYNNSADNCRKYGRLYTWEAAKRAANRVSGWHLPSDAEWKQLERHLGMSSSDANDTGYRGNGIGSKLKSTYGWYNGGNGNNSSGFNALPAGYRYSDGDFKFLGKYAIFWSSSPSGSSNAWKRYLYYSDSEVDRNDGKRSYAYSVRLVRDF